MTVTTVVASWIVDDGIEEEDDEVVLCCTVGVDADWVSTGAVEVWRTVKALLDVTVDGPAGVNENDVEVVVIPGKETKMHQQLHANRKCNMSPVLLPDMAKICFNAAQDPFEALLRVLTRDNFNPSEKGLNESRRLDVLIVSVGGVWNNARKMFW